MAKLILKADVKMFKKIHLLAKPKNQNYVFGF